MARIVSELSFLRVVHELVGGEYSVLEKYVKSSIPIKFKHNTCGHEWNVRPNSFISANTRCPKCFKGGKKQIKSSEFSEKAKAALGVEYELLGDYIQSKTRIEVKHLVCGKTYFQFPRSILQGRMCHYCCPSRKKTTNEVSLRISEITNFEYGLVGEYNGAHEKMIVNHKECNSNFKVTYSNFVNAGTRCPKCAESKGERKIREWLSEHRIAFLAQEPIRYNVKKVPLYLDFYARGVAIEFDGEQHFKAIDHFGGEGGLRDTQRRDAIKTQYCADNGIPLMRIPYWDFDNIDAILTEKLLPLLDASMTQKRAS